MKSYQRSMRYWMLILAALTGLVSCTSPGINFSEKTWQADVAATRTSDLYAPHFRNGRFFNPWHPMPDKSFLDVLQWRLFHRNQGFTDSQKTYLPQVIPDAPARIRSFDGDFIMWIGHNTFLVRIDNVWWLTDPIFTRRALLPARKTPPALTLDELNRLVGNARLNVLISHNHYDHLDRKSITGLPVQTAVYVPKGLASLVRGMSRSNVREMDWWDQLETDSGDRLTCLPAQHWSMRISMGRNKSLWASFMLQSQAGTFYFGGDTGYFRGFEEFGQKFPSIDYAFLATTAYYPRWFMHYQHMNIPEAVAAFDKLGARYFIPTQWGTFHLGDEPVGVPALELTAYINKRDLPADRFKILDIGQILPITL